MSEIDTDIRADLCSVEGCEEPQESRDLCRAHYEVWLANREKPTVTKSKREVMFGAVSGCPIERLIERIWLD
jgi:hypothetical protein